MTLVTVVRCERCRGTEHVIVGDGPPVCWPCVSLLGETAADPLTASPRLRETLAYLHADVVTLGETARGFPEWEWTAPWPGVRT